MPVTLLEVSQKHLNEHSGNQAMTCQRSQICKVSLLRCVFVSILAPVFCHSLLHAQSPPDHVWRPYDERTVHSSFDKGSRYLFFSANWSKQNVSNRATYERHVADAKTNKSVVDVGRSKSDNQSDEAEQDASMNELRRVIRELKDIQSRHPKTRAAIIAEQLLKDAERIRVAPQDDFLSEE